MKAEKIVKKQARKALSKGNLPAAAGVTTILCASVMTCIYLAGMLTDTLGFALDTFLGISLEDIDLLYSAVFMLFTAGAFILILPLFCGNAKFYYRIAKSEDCVFSDLFYYLQKGRYFSTIGKMLKILVAHFWQALVSFLPGALIFLSAAGAAQDKDHLDFYNILWYAISYAMIIAGVFLFSFLTSGKSLAIYILTENEELTAKDALMISEQAMSGYEKSVHRIMFRYLPFLLLCLAVIPILFVIPYIMTSSAVSAKWIIMLHNKQNEG